MLLSRAWLELYVDLKNISDLDIARHLSEKVAEVEHTAHTGCSIEGVVVGKILTIDAVPGADKIRVTTVDVGGESPLTIVCGAQNICVGATVPVACLGATLPGDFRIERRKMRGIESMGMLCSGKELGIGEDHAGIMLLSSGLTLGTPLTEILPSDTVYTIDNHAITHRPDLFCHVGFARELAVIFDRELRLPKRVGVLPAGGEKITVTREDVALCTAYVALKVTGIRVQESPKEIQERLTAAGMRPINNVVDATNYVMLELGQPMHAFDAGKIVGGITVRRGKAGEKLETLDGRMRELKEAMLVIADDTKALALAGVMGGKESEVSSATMEIILESATFDAVNIRQTSRELALRSEASMRYEKRLDRELTVPAMLRCVEILKMTCPDIEVVAVGESREKAEALRVIAVPYDMIEKKIGMKIEFGEIVRILVGLGFFVAVDDDEVALKAITEIQVTVPSMRAGRDMAMADDVIEEVARMAGYGSVVPVAPQVRLKAVEKRVERELAETLRDALVGMGCYETVTLALVSKELLEKAHAYVEGVTVGIMNPPSEEYQYLRISLLPSLLQVAERNKNEVTKARYMEIATICHRKKDGILEESPELVVVVTGEDEPLRTVCGMVEAMADVLKLEIRCESADTVQAVAHPGRHAAIVLGGRRIGTAAELHPAVGERFGLGRVGYISLGLERLVDVPREVVVAQEVPQYPGIVRDMSVLLPQAVLCADMVKKLATVGPEVAAVTAVDEYVGDGVPVGMRVVTLRMLLRDATGTLLDAVAERVLEKAREAAAEMGGVMRSGA